MKVDLNTKSQDSIFIEVSGFSMRPFLKTGERLVVKKVPVKDLRRGDIILYKADNQLVCHRLVKKIVSESGYLLYTRGDASPKIGEPITESALVGKVTGILRKGGIINFTGKWSYFVNRLIVEFAPFIRIGIKLSKRPIQFLKNLRKKYALRCTPRSKSV